MTIQEQFSTSNVIYKITQDIDLSGGTLTIPSGCTLDFQGGTISNGIIEFNNTQIENKSYNNIFINIKVNGIIENDIVYIKWFGNNLNNIRNIIRSNTTYIFDTNEVYDISNQIEVIKEGDSEYAVFYVENKVNIIFDCNNSTFIYNHNKSDGYRNGGIFYIDNCDNITIKNIICDGNYTTLEKDGYDANNRIFICRNINYSKNIHITNFNIKHFSGAIYSGTWNPSSGTKTHQGYIENLVVNGYSNDVRYVIAVEGCYNLMADIVAIYAHRPCYLGAVNTAMINIICRESTTTTFCLLTDSLFLDENNNKKYLHCRNINVNLKIDGIPNAVYNANSRNGILIQQYENYIDRDIDYIIDNININYYVPKDSETQNVKYIGFVFNDNIPNNKHNDILQNCNVSITCDNNSICQPSSIKLYHAQLVNFKFKNCIYKYNPSSLFEEGAGGASITVSNTITNPSNVVLENHQGNVYCIQTGGNIKHENALNVTIIDSIIPNLFYNGVNDTTKYRIINSDIKNVVYNNIYTEYINTIPNYTENISKINYLSINDTGRNVYNKTINKQCIWDGNKWVDYDGADSRVIRNGNISERPIKEYIYSGFEFFDTSINKPIWWNGTKWVGENTIVNAGTF